MVKKSRKTQVNSSWLSKKTIYLNRRIFLRSQDRAGHHGMTFGGSRCLMVFRPKLFGGIDRWLRSAEGRILRLVPYRLPLGRPDDRRLG